MTHKVIEILARGICLEIGGNPDFEIPYSTGEDIDTKPLWTEFVSNAEDMIELYIKSLPPEVQD